MECKIAVCLERCAQPSYVALGLLKLRMPGMAVCPSLLKLWKERMAVCLERCAKPKHHRWLRFAPLSRQTAILGVKLELGTRIGIPGYRDIGISGLALDTTPLTS